jgi:hypothetical protein
MGERIGLPLIEEVGKPRVLPDAVPLPIPEKAPAPGKKEPVKVLPDGTEARASHDTRWAIAKAAEFLGITEAQVAQIILDIADHIGSVLHVGELGKKPPGTTPSISSQR